MSRKVDRSQWKRTPEQVQMDLRNRRRAGRIPSGKAYKRRPKHRGDW